MRKIEEKIIDAINAGETVTLSKRDRIVNDSDVVKYVWLWNTNIARVYPDRIEIDAGGWRTATTKSRLNAILWAYCATGIYRHKGAWFLNGYADTRYAGRPVVKVVDGMSIPRKHKRWDGDKWIVSNL